jgi:hypothetical protein
MTDTNDPLILRIKLERERQDLINKSTKRTKILLILNLIVWIVLLTLILK